VIPHVWEGKSHAQRIDQQNIFKYMYNLPLEGKKKKKKKKKTTPDKQKGSNPKARSKKDAKRQLATQVKTMCAHRANLKIPRENKRQKSDEEKKRLHRLPIGNAGEPR